jgi:hypothetical protein
MVWLCPVCADRISGKRTAELLDALTESVDTDRVNPEGTHYVERKLKYHVAMMTFTVGHKRADHLDRTMQILKTAYHALWSGRFAQNFYQTFNIIGSVRAVEVTHGFNNGWHPHIHTLLISSEPFRRTKTDDLLAMLSGRWQDAVEDAGGYCTLDRGFDIRAGKETLIEYVNKAGQNIAKTKLEKEVVMEETKAPAKRGHNDGRTLWQLLADYVRGDITAGWLWIDAQKELKGTRQLLPSKGIQALLRDPDALSDDIAGIVERRKEDILLASLTLDQWKLVNRWGLRGQLLMAAKNGGEDGVTGFLTKLERVHGGGVFIPS